MTLTDSDRKDAELAVQVRKGQVDTFAILIRRFESRIYNFCHQFFRNSDIAAETTQETFLRAYRYINRYDATRKFSTWLYRIARNICIDEKRKLDRGKLINFGDSVPENLLSENPGRHLTPPHEALMQMEARIVLEQAIVQLPEKYRTAIILRYYHDLPYQEIADVMGLDLNVVKIRIYRAKRMLLEILEERSKG